jgi:hypothetical protein
MLTPKAPLAGPAKQEGTCLLSHNTEVLQSEGFANTIFDTEVCMLADLTVGWGALISL